MNRLEPRPLIRLGVNIDHVATLRQARRTLYPQVLQAALTAEQAGADGITAHLREDRRHIQDRDIDLLRETLQTKLNLEMAVTEAWWTSPAASGHTPAAWCRKNARS